MRVLLVGLALSALVAIFSTPATGEISSVAEECDLCICANDEIVCLPAFPAEAGEEQTVCGIACSNIGSSYSSRQRVDAACSEIAQCNGLSAPAASGIWLAMGAFGLLVFGTLMLRRIGARSAT